MLLIRFVLSVAIATPRFGLVRARPSLLFCSLFVVAAVYDRRRFWFVVSLGFTPKNSLPV